MVKKSHSKEELKPKTDEMRRRAKNLIARKDRRNLKREGWKDALLKLQDYTRGKTPAGDKSRKPKTKQKRIANR